MADFFLADPFIAFYRSLGGETSTLMDVREINVDDMNRALDARNRLSAQLPKFYSGIKDIGIIAFYQGDKISGYSVTDASGMKIKGLPSFTQDDIDKLPEPCR